jgi:transcriptional regulator with XRE-family HTH domain
METTSERVAANVAVLRGRRGLSVRTLSARLGGLGHPILPSGITKIENGSRRVDVEDLLALAVALDVSPVTLLMPHEPTDEGVALTPAVTASAQAAWRWAVGEQPLVRSGGGQLELGSPEWRAFVAENRPFEGRYINEVARAFMVRERGPFEAHISFDGEAVKSRFELVYDGADISINRQPAKPAKRAARKPRES